MITLFLTPAEHTFLLLKLGRGTGSTIRPGESLSAVESLALIEKLEMAGLLDRLNDAVCERTVDLLGMGDQQLLSELATT